MDDVIADPLLFFSGLTLCAGVGVAASGWSWAAWRRRADSRRRYEAQKRDFLARLQATARVARADRTRFLGWQGTRPLRVSAVVDEARHIKSFYLTSLEGRPLPPFEPGQYLTFHVQTAPNEKPLVRCYSLSDRPRDEYYRITVKRCGPPNNHPELPAGRVSNYLHEQVTVGRTLHATAPQGAFFLDPRGSDPVVLVAGGIGVTPLLSMLVWLLHTGDRREVYFLYGVRNGAEHPFREVLEELADRHPQVKLFTAYSSPRIEDVELRDYQHRGRIDHEYLQHVLPPGDYHYYLCGPGSMMSSIHGALVDDGVSEERIHFEAFGPASLKRGRTPEVDDACYPVRFEASSTSLEWTPQFASLLDLAESSGLQIESGCRAGNCGQCLLPVLSGEVTFTKPPGANVPTGHCLACISVPASEVVIDA